MESVVEVMGTELRGFQKVLDAGVGTGRFAVPLGEKGLDVTGLDVSVGMLSEAKKKGATGLVRGDLVAMPFEDQTFGSCLMIHVLHLVANLGSFLSEIARVTRHRVVSLSETSDHENVRELYIECMKNAGYRWEAVSEQKLISVLPPMTLKDISDYSSESKADDDIDHFRDRLSAVTWDVPEEAHRRIIERLRSMVGGKVIRQNRSVRLAVWEVQTIRSTRLLF